MRRITVELTDSAYAKLLRYARVKRLSVSGKVIPFTLEMHAGHVLDRALEEMLELQESFAAAVRAAAEMGRG